MTRDLQSARNGTRLKRETCGTHQEQADADDLAAIGFITQTTFSEG